MAAEPYTLFCVWKTKLCFHDVVFLFSKAGFPPHFIKLWQMLRPLDCYRSVNCGLGNARALSLSLSCGGQENELMALDLL